jgi:hypothetical protein
MIVTGHIADFMDTLCMYMYVTPAFSGIAYMGLHETNVVL